MYPTNYTLVIEINYGPLVTPLINTIPFDTDSIAHKIFLERAKAAVDVVLFQTTECKLTLYKGDDIIKALVFSSLPQ